MKFTSIVLASAAYLVASVSAFKFNCQGGYYCGMNGIKCDISRAAKEWNKGKPLVNTITSKGGFLKITCQSLSGSTQSNLRDCKNALDWQ